MISDARGKHVSPGMYFDERDVVYAPKSLGSTSLGLVGETLYGPAFQNVEIQDWGEFLDYFGGTSTEKIALQQKDGEDIGYAPKYQLPYIAKNYLKESKKLNVVRVLGLSGYQAGTGFQIYESSGNDNNLLAVLRSYVTLEGETGCDGTGAQGKDLVTKVTVDKYEPKTFQYGCTGTTSSTSNTITYPNKFSITITYNTDITSQSGRTSEKYNVSLNPNDSDYIKKVLTKDTGLYVEGVYSLSKDNFTLQTGDTTTYKNVDFKESYRPAVTPWFVSEAIVDYTTGDTPTVSAVHMKKLFKFVTISDGEAANYMIKVSIQNINPVAGTFDVVVRDYNDSNLSPVILERFRGCTMNLGETSYIGYKIGTLDGRFIAKSKYILVVVDEDVDLSGNVPCGFIGYPIPSGYTAKPEIKYDSVLTKNDKPKNHYFGINTRKDFFEDFLGYKGVSAYTNDDFDLTANLNKGFHMDTALSGVAKENVYVDGLSGFEFEAASLSGITSGNLLRLISNEGYLKNTAYKDMNNRKFTVCFYGGFDGWDINRDSRTNTDEFKSTEYNAAAEGSAGYELFDNNGIDGKLILPEDANTSDYYAYLAAYNVFANPEDVDINILATPGIDWYHHGKLTQEVLDLVEDTEKRHGDTIYVMDSPNGYDAKALSELFADSEINSSYACTFYPWVLYKDAANKQYIELSPTKDVVRDMAYTDKHYETWFAPAGTKRGDVDCEKASFKTTLTDEDYLYGNLVNPVKTFSKDGVKIWGNKTAYPVESPLNRINVRRLMIWLKKTIKDASIELIFDQYDETLEEQFRDIVEPKLKDVKTKRGIYDFLLQVEDTPETRDEHILPAKLLVKPTPTMEYISLSFVVYPESVDFTEG